MNMREDVPEMTDVEPERFRPLLAAAFEDGSQLQGRLILSPKVDGIRVLCHPRLGPVTRSLKPVPNDFIRQTLIDHRLYGFDGEIVVGELEHPQLFNQTTSGVMSQFGNPDFTYYVFDQFYQEDGTWLTEKSTAPYLHRLRALERRAEDYENQSRNASGFSRVRLLEYVDSTDPVDDVLPESRMTNSQLIDFWEQEYLLRGFEGLMIRSASGRYKLNRSTLKEGILIKLKRFADGEAVIEGVEELLHNQNAATRDLRGYTERSDHQANKVGGGTLGALIVRADPWGSFNVGSGFDAATREDLWNRREEIIGKTIKFKHQKIGGIDKPRFPIFLGFRGEE